MVKMTFTQFYNKYYKLCLIIPAILILLSFIYLYNFNQVNGDFIYKDISLTGGTSATIQGNIDIPLLEANLVDKLEEVNIRKIYDIVTNEEKAVIIETKSPPEETKEVLEDYLGYELNTENSSFEYTGSSLSESFYKQLLIAILIAFIFMAIVVFAIFRTLIPSTAVIISAFADILMTLITVNLLGIKLSTAGIVAFLMILGYSVDTDIVLTNRVLKRKGKDINKKILGAFKTGIMMSLTSLVAITAALLIARSFSSTLNQMFTILLIGLIFDIFNTWVTNASIIKWYAERKNEI